MASPVLGIPLLWAVGAALLGWSRFPAVWRRRVALVWGMAGLVSLMVALTTEGSRASPTVAVFLMGAHYVTSTAQASASLPFYLLSGVFLLLGFAGLAVSDEVAAWLTRHWLGGAILLGLGITALRFLLEKTAAPPFLTQLVGVTWLAPVVGAFFFWSVRAEGRAFVSVVRPLALYAVVVRSSILLLMLLATTRRLGSHYDVTPLTLVENPLTGRSHEFVPGSLPQFVNLALIPQLAVWPVFTVAAGLVGALCALILEASWQASKRKSVSMPSATVPDEEEAISARGRP
jgi:hypothetical protein